jgi:hypothetical protein
VEELYSVEVVLLEDKFAVPNVGCDIVGVVIIMVIRRAVMTTKFILAIQ